MRRRSATVVFVALSALSALMAVPATASASDPASAQMLFDEARRLMNEQKWAEACPKLEESQRLDPAGGTALHLAVCREHEGKIATAWALYRDALSLAKRDGRRDRAKAAQERIDALGPMLPRMKLNVAAKAAALAKLTITRDDVEMSRALWGESLPVDPGRFTLVARAPGKRVFTTVVHIAKLPGVTTIDIPALEDDATPDSSPAPSHPHASDPSSSADTGSTQRVIAYSVGGLGIVGLAIGSVYGAMSIGNRATVRVQCRPPEFKLCTPVGFEAGESALRNGNMSTGAFVVGGLLVAGGLALYFTAPSSPRGGVALTPTVGPGTASLDLTGRF